MKPRNSPLALRRRQAKAGMAVAMGTLVTTGFLSNSKEGWTPKLRALHLCAGVALVGFSYWHWTLYQEPYSAKGRRS